MNPSIDLGSLRKALLEERRSQLAHIRSLVRFGLGESQQEAARELSGYDQHTADHGTETYEREKDFGLLARAQEVVRQIDDALKRMDEGTYGTCRRCGAKIDEERLAALPYASRCVSCEQEVEEEYHRPVEEDRSYPAFTEALFEDADDPGYGREDVWQEIARHGTANSPQDLPDDLDLEM